MRWIALALGVVGVCVCVGMAADTGTDVPQRAPVPPAAVPARQSVVESRPSASLPAASSRPVAKDPFVDAPTRPAEGPSAFTSSARDQQALATVAAALHIDRTEAARRVTDPAKLAEIMRVLETHGEAYWTTYFERDRIAVAEAPKLVAAGRFEDLPLPNRPRPDSPPTEADRKLLADVEAAAVPRSPDEYVLRMVVSAANGAGVVQRLVRFGAADSARFDDATRAYSAVRAVMADELRPLVGN
jgi:hypothetical protein